MSGYRRVAPEWDEFAADLDAEGEPGFDRERLLRCLRVYFDRRKISADWDAMTKCRGPASSPRSRWSARSTRARSRRCSKPPTSASAPGC